MTVWSLLAPGGLSQNTIHGLPDPIVIENFKAPMKREEEQHCDVVQIVNLLRPCAKLDEHSHVESSHLEESLQGRKHPTMATFAGKT